MWNTCLQELKDALAPHNASHHCSVVRVLSAVTDVSHLCFQARVFDEMLLLAPHPRL